MIILFISMSIVKVQAQATTDPDTTYYNRIEPVQLQLSKYPHGTIQWQVSGNGGNTWYNIPGEESYTLEYSADTTVQVRAAVLSGTCDTLYSQTALLRNLMIYTEKVDSITQSTAWISGVTDTAGIAFTEYGVLYKNQPQVDEASEKLTLQPPVRDTFRVLIDGLNAGTTYYARAYGLTGDGHYIYGNILSFNPIKVTLHHTLNISEDTAGLTYEVTGLDPADIDEHGLFINSEPGSPETADMVAGYSDRGVLTAVARTLQAGTDYYVRAFVRQDENYYYSEEKKITTWSVYDDPVDNSPFTISHRIEWDDPSTAVKLTPEGTFGEYGRVERLGNTDTLMLVYHGGPNNGNWINIYLRKSYNNGTSWESQEILMDLADYPGEYWRFCTPEILSLQNGWVMVAFEANARPDENESSVQVLISKDSARTWEGPVVIKTGRSWEPSMVQLPHGEIELFFSSEAKWWPDDPIYQDIQVTRSTDNGLSWSDPQVVAYYPQKRDGMPVPLVLQGNKGVVFAIETVGSPTSPYIVQRDMDTPWILTTSNFESSPHRWLITGFSGHGGAPYLIQLPSGETVLSAHIYRGGDWHQNNYQQVMIGDNEARNFEGLTNPWGTLPWNESTVNNSLFMINDTTIVTISTRMFPDAMGGLYWLKGNIVPE